MPIENRIAVKHVLVLSLFSRATNGFARFFFKEIQPHNMGFCDMDLSNYAR